MGEKKEQWRKLSSIEGKKFFEGEVVIQARCCRVKVSTEYVRSLQDGQNEKWKREVQIWCEREMMSDRVELKTLKSFHKWSV